MIHLYYDLIFSVCCNISVTSGAYYTAETEKNEGVPGSQHQITLVTSVQIRPDVLEVIQSPVNGLLTGNGIGFAKLECH
jgi:hypothetical protein